MISAIIAATLFRSTDPAPSRMDSLVEAAWQQANNPPQTPPTQTPPSQANAAQTAAAQAAAERDEKKHQDDLKYDREVGKKYSAEVAKEFTIISDPEEQARVDRIGHELADIANRTQTEALWGDKRMNTFDYTFTIIEDKKHPDDVNAFSIPGGYIYVYQGLLKFIESDDELAGVLGHEISHAKFRHVATLTHEESKLTTMEILPLLLAIFAKGAEGAAGVLQPLSLLNQAMGSGWSVKAEEAADYGGFQLLLKSKYDPTGMLTFMERLAAKERRESLNYELGIFRTHPPSRDRADSLIHYMSLANVPIRRSRVAYSFRADARPADNGKMQISFGGRPLFEMAGPDALARANAAVEKLNDFFDSVPEAYEIQASADGSFVARRDDLFQLTAEDAAAASMTLPELQRSALQRIRAVLYTIGFRVWETR